MEKKSRSLVAALKKLDDSPQSKYPAHQHNEPKGKHQQAMLGAVPDAKLIIPVYRVPIAYPQRNLHSPSPNKIVPHTRTPPSMLADSRRRHLNNKRG